MWDNKTIEWLDIELTSFCNIDCPGCFRQIKRKVVSHILDTEMLSFERLRKWITPKEFPKLKLVNFCGSIDEPTLHPELLDIVKYFNKHSVSINISSNGSTKTEKFWYDLGKEKVSVFFGIDGIDQESIEKYRIGANFKKLQKNWRAFINAGGKATWQFIAFEHNEHLLEDAKRMADEEGFDNFRVIYSHRSDNKESKTKIRDEEQEIVCKYGVQKRLFLSHTGTLLPCCFFNSEFLQVHSGGGNETRYTEKYLELEGPLESNLKYTTPTEVIEGDMFKFIVDSWSNKPLERCWETCKKAKQDIFVDEELK